MKNKTDFHDPITLEEVATVECETLSGKILMMGYWLRKTSASAAEAARALVKATYRAGIATREFERVSSEIDEQVIKAAGVPRKYMGEKKSKHSPQYFEYKSNHLINSNKSRDL